MRTIFAQRGSLRQSVPAGESPHVSNRPVLALSVEPSSQRGIVSRENAELKARRYLVEGRLEVQRVDHDLVLARCLGDEGDLYAVRWDQERHAWRCNCPAYGPRCAHVLALARVTRKPA
jgi:SWIM zinc finger